VQYAVDGLEVVAIAAELRRRETGAKLGALTTSTAPQRIQVIALLELGGAKVVWLQAVGSKEAGSGKNGKGAARLAKLMCSAPPRNQVASSFDLLFRQPSVIGALTGTPAVGDQTLKFSVPHRRAAMVEK